MFHHVLEHATVVSHSEFVQHLRKDFSEAAQIAQTNAIREQDRHAKLYDRKVRGLPLGVGDRVLLANRGERGRRKLADRWNPTPFDVVSVRSDINVYRIRDVVTSREKFVHRNMLLPVDFLAVPEQEGDPASLGESQSMASCASAQGSVASDGREASWLRTRDWALESPEEAGAESIPDEETGGEVEPVDALMDDDSVPDDSIPDSTSDDLSDAVRDAVHLPDDRSDVIDDLPVPEVGPEQDVCTRSQSARAPSVVT